MATARASRRLAAGDNAHAPLPHATPAVGPVSSGSGSGSGGGGRAQEFNLSSGAATAVVFVSILLCFILLCTYCRCARQRAVAGARRRVMRDLVPGVALFLRPSAAALPPVVPYAVAAASAGAAKKKGLMPEDCPICLEPFGDDDGVRVVPACGHLYHAPCIDRWLDVRNSCPVCRCAVATLYAAADRDRDAAAVADGAHDDDDDDQEAVLQRVVAMIEAIRVEQREDAVARRAPAGGGGGS
ncbi:RING-H2 finger protein ATL74-like [Miscanthus floridulus]|uniref:RING-H2 finger protein ATL74-like n=1 Tax=Miscanthus floridulus TaxID=154761 RepID=UPI00345832EA